MSAGCHLATAPAIPGGATMAAPLRAARPLIPHPRSPLMAFKTLIPAVYARRLGVLASAAALASLT
ncbi:hypothetical protein ACFWAP_31340, partial [Streptomyces goshikiensis]